MERSKGRYYSRRDVRFMNSLNGELMLDIIEQIIVVYKINPSQTKSTIYGEAMDKIYYPI